MNEWMSIMKKMVASRYQEESPWWYHCFGREEHIFVKMQSSASTSARAFANKIQINSLSCSPQYPGTTSDYFQQLLMVIIHVWKSGYISLKMFLNQPYPLISPSGNRSLHPNAICLASLLQSPFFSVPLTMSWAVLRAKLPRSCLTHGLYLTRLLCPWDSPGKSTGGGCISFSGDLPDPGLDLCLQDSLLLSRQG